jgi:hypothetical protein
MGPKLLEMDAVLKRLYQSLARDAARTGTRTLLVLVRAPMLHWCEVGIRREQSSELRSAYSLARTAADGEHQHNGVSLEQLTTRWIGCRRATMG